MTPAKSARDEARRIQVVLPSKSLAHYAIQGAALAPESPTRQMRLGHGDVPEIA